MIDKKFVKQIVDYKKSEDKSGKVLKNRLVEIILVKVGILLALAIYGIYQEYQEKKQMQATFLSMHKEIVPAIELGASKLKKDNQLIDNFEVCLHIINNKNLDSLDYLKKNIGPLLRVRNQEFSFPAVSDFVNSGKVAKLKNRETASLFRKMQYELNALNAKHAYNVNEYQLTIAPLTNKFLNYSELATPEQQENMVVGGPESNFDVLFDNLELWNIINQKLENYNYQKTHVVSFTKLLEELDEAIKTEIDL
ncbi:hypothetical protein [Formosa algae]|uniref:Uncharacterized protein n=1 Tax=Formosa algae TaxID=225843 RepID=A0A9X0YMD1_9FLAO|nr:hypothetical protein [Formosa algae]MBP1839601.1 hypothetical protein [Formosa algae]MDQ0334905.1 hypothetical protein [Formosa algae]OEI80595.1 hypothetical protein AST99_08390 [Formosa algae]